MIELMLADYATGKYTVEMIGKKYGISTGKTYYMLRDAGCEFTHKVRNPMSDEARQRISAGRKGIKFPEKWCKAISDAKKCNYNGLNGYGHTKSQSRGYVIAYAPLHPHAHKDGYVMLHTILMERLLGRYLESDEVVHHINHDRTDNRIENLLLMKKHEHCSMHMKERYANKRRNDLLIV